MLRAHRAGRGRGRGGNFIAAPLTNYARGRGDGRGRGRGRGGQVGRGRGSYANATETGGSSNQNPWDNGAVSVLKQKTISIKRLQQSCLDAKHADASPGDASQRDRELHGRPGRVSEHEQLQHPLRDLNEE